MSLFKHFLFFLLAFTVTPVSADIYSYFNRIQSEPKALYTFLKTMPKGGELHYHLSGGAYPETMLSLAAKHSYCIKDKSYDVSKQIITCDGIHSKELTTKPELYKKVIRAWSMKDFLPSQESGHDHFFGSFFKFAPLVADFRPQLLASVMKRAASQHELYLEIMILPDNAQSTTFANLIDSHIKLKDKQRILLADKNFQKNIRHTVDESENILKLARRELGCDLAPEQDVCSLTIKFQYYVLREQSLNKLFAQALNGFAAVSRSPHLVGINLVQAEDGATSLRDYKKQMQVFQFLHQVYPDVHIALHAGELSPNIVTPDNLRFHIRDAIFIGNAERIGHGVDVAYENQSAQLVKYMASKPIAVEINLTSNHHILNIAGPRHPLHYYLDQGVPVVLSTDDEGILRTNLTHEYMRAVQEHKVDYLTLKMINRNALTYSFLPGKSLWADAKNATLVHECIDLESTSCQKFIKKNEKAYLQWLLEKKLKQFERPYNA